VHGSSRAHQFQGIGNSPNPGTGVQSAQTDLTSIRVLLANGDGSNPRKKVETRLVATPKSQGSQVTLPVVMSCIAAAL
jgi:hypothetical protein